MFIKPNPLRKVGDEPLKVYDPVHRDFLPEGGRKVADNAYWVRRLATKDVVEVTETASTDNKKAPKASTGKAKNEATKNKAKSSAKAKKETAPADDKNADAIKTNKNKGE